MISERPAASQTLNFSPPLSQRKSLKSFTFSEEIPLLAFLFLIFFVNGEFLGGFEKWWMFFPLGNPDRHTKAPRFDQFAPWPRGPTESSGRSGVPNFCKMIG